MCIHVDAASGPASAGVQPPQARSTFVWLLSPPPGEKSEDARAEPLICGNSTSPAFTSEVTPPSVRARAQGGPAAASTSRAESSPSFPPSRRAPTHARSRRSPSRRCSAMATGGSGHVDRARGPGPRSPRPGTRAQSGIRQAGRAPSYRAADSFLQFPRSVPAHTNPSRSLLFSGHSSVTLSSLGCGGGRRRRPQRPTVQGALRFLFTWPGFDGALTPRLAPGGRVGVHALTIPCTGGRTEMASLGS
jgi:hypothetical protein